MRALAAITVALFHLACGRTELSREAAAAGELPGTELPGTELPGTEVPELIGPPCATACCPADLHHRRGGDGDFGPGPRTRRWAAAGAGLPLARQPGRASPAGREDGRRRPCSTRNAFAAPTCGPTR